MEEPRHWKSKKMYEILIRGWGVQISGTNPISAVTEWLPAINRMNNKDLQPHEITDLKYLGESQDDDPLILLQKAYEENSTMYSEYKDKIESLERQILLLSNTTESNNNVLED